MGYESKLVVIKKGSLGINEECHKAWAEKIAEVNMCVMDSSVSSKMRNYPPTEYYYYSDDGDTPILEDKYGKPLTEIPLVDAIQMLEESEKEEHYRRYSIAIGLLKAFVFEDWHDNVVVLHYGY